MSWAPRGRRMAFGLAVGAASIAVLAIGRELGEINPEPSVLCFELTFGREQAAEILEHWPVAARFRAMAAIKLDFWFIPAYVLLWLLLTAAASRVLELSSRTRSLVLAAPLLAGGLDVLENVGMQSMLAHGPDSWWPLLSSSAALAKFFLLAAGPLLWLAAVWHRATGGESLQHRERSRIAPRKSFAEVRRAELENIADARREMGSESDLARAPLVGLAFSGGGIRSATFNLGLLQALARLRLLPHVDFLSSVSGGGYIASWLNKWARDPQSSVTTVTEALGRDSEHTGHEPANVSFLRDYSNYLTPRVGVLSADSWTTFATYARNFLLNLVILVGGGIVLLLVPRMIASLLSLFDSVCAACPAAWWPRFHFLLAFLLATTAVRFLGVNLLLADPDQRVKPAGPTVAAVASQTAVQLRIVLPLVLSALLAAYWLHRDPDLASLTARLPNLGEVVPWPALVAWTLLTSFAYAGAWAMAGVAAYRFRQRLPDGQKQGSFDASTVGALVSTAPWVGFAAGFALFFLARELSQWSLWQLVAFGPPVMMTLFTLIAVLHIGLMGRRFKDPLREWMARAGAWITIYGVGWVAFFGLATYAPVVVAQAKGWVMTTVTGGWVVSSLAGVFAGRAQQAGTERGWHRPLLRLAPWIFVIGLMATLSWGLDALLARPHAELWADFTQRPSDTSPAAAVATFAERMAAHEQLLRAEQESGRFWLLALLLGPLVWIFSGRLDINEFSMHQYYRNRLVRCYLGASNRRRQPQSFTDFDASDDEALGSSRPYRPYHLINTALNVSNGQRLSWQQRKASSFVLAPLYSGFENPPDACQPLGQSRENERAFDRPAAAEGAYRQTSGIDRLSLGTAMAISGAAVSPNMGYHSSPALNLLLTIFNVRLGWWLGNPKSDRTWNRIGPKKALWPLLAELFGLTSEDSDYVYLSDGGHFENLGVYELVRRRCRFIIASDASADPDLEFADLGNAIRKCRIDFGVAIDVDTSTLAPDAEGKSRRHCVVGRIEYPQGAEAEDTPQHGWLLYIKASLTGDEPRDVLQYARAEQSFPHQSTGDQFFDESQFESYRSLGQHIGERVFATASDHVGERFERWETLFRDVRERWYAPSTVTEGSFSRHGQTLSQLFARLGNSPDLQFLDAEIYPEWTELEDQSWDSKALPDGAEKLRAGFYFCNSLLQLMESVYLDLRLDDEHAHPDNRGWINLFRQWAKSPMVRATWAISAATYGARFQTFSARRLGLKHGAVTIRRATGPALDLLEQQVRSEWTRPGVAGSGDAMVSDVVSKGGDWYHLELELPGTLSLPVGFCILESRARSNQREESARGARPYLLYFHVLPHLRNTGLAQRGLAALAKSQKGLLLVPDADRLASIPGSIWNSFKNLFRSST